jgi:hypothetical protein
MRATGPTHLILKKVLYHETEISYTPNVSNVVGTFTSSYGRHVAVTGETEYQYMASSNGCKQPPVSDSNTNGSEGTRVHMRQNVHVTPGTLKL